MDRGSLIFLLFIACFICVILFYINHKKKERISQLEIENSQLKKEIRGLNDEIKTKTTLLQSEYLRLKDYLLEKAQGYFVESEKFKNMEPLHASLEYQQILNSIVDDYHNTFTDEGHAIEHVSSLMADYITYPIWREEQKLAYGNSKLRYRALTVEEIRLETAKIIKEHYYSFYKAEQTLAQLKKAEVYEEVICFINSNRQLSTYVSKIISDIETADFEAFAKSLDYGNSKQRQSRITTIRQVRAEAKAKIEKLKWAEYQLTYLLSLYPTLQDVIETEYSELDISIDEITDSDPVRNFLSTEEWNKLSETEKNQLALDRYIESRKKSKWQIGRDYELYIGYCYEQKGYKLNYFGSYMGLEDLGRDLIAKKSNKTLIIQCKYWSKEKLIHEKHIMQLYGSIIAYQIENPNEDITGMLVTNISLSETARKFADILGIRIVENKDIGDFPRIKCNIGHDEFGQTRIYHLPMDFQYDKTKIEKAGELMVSTVAEAEALGFRRTYKWHGNNS